MQHPLRGQGSAKPSKHKSKYIGKYIRKYIGKYIGTDLPSHKPYAKKQCSGLFLNAVEADRYVVKTLK